MKACSSAESAGAFAESSLFQSGPPVNSSPSHQTVPASRASRSVLDIGGSMRLKTSRKRFEISTRRSGRILRRTYGTKKAHRTVFHHGAPAPQNV